MINILQLDTWPETWPNSTVPTTKVFRQFFLASSSQTCAHPTVKLSSTNSETKSCQTFPTDQDKKIKMPQTGAKLAENQSDKKLTSAPPDITQVNSHLESRSSSGNIYWVEKTGRCQTILLTTPPTTDLVAGVTFSLSFNFRCFYAAKLLSSLCSRNTGEYLWLGSTALLLIFNYYNYKYWPFTAIN